MKREIKNDGVYVEVDASEILDNLEALKEAKIVVVTSARIELADGEKDTFMKNIQVIHDMYSKTSAYYSGSELSNRQRSDMVFRQLIFTTPFFVSGVAG